MSARGRDGTRIHRMLALTVLLVMNAKARQQQMRQTITMAGNIGRAQRPLHLFSGLIRCGVCGSSYVVCSAHRLACIGRRDRGVCANQLTIRRDEVEARVLAALQNRFFENDHFQAFCEEFTAAVNEARMEHRGSLSFAEREIARIEARRKKLIDMVMDGIAPSEVKDEMNANAARREELKLMLELADDPPPLLHPNMADLWRTEVTELRNALAEDRCDAVAREAVRQMVLEIRLTPRDGLLAIDVKGNLAAMLARASPAEDWDRQLAMVAGGGFEPPTFGL